MSSTDTKWKQKIKKTDNTEGLENIETDKKTNRVEKDNAQNQMLADLKMRIKGIQNKRNGFTKLPHLTDIVTEGSEKEAFVEGIGDVTSVLRDKVAALPVDKSGNIYNWFSGQGTILGLYYGVFLIIYLQLYHLNFRADIELKFPNTDEKGGDAVEGEEKKPSDWGAIRDNILDSLTKTLGGIMRRKGMMWELDPNYVDIKHNNFLKYMNYIARFDRGIFMRYIFIPAQVIVGITEPLIPNLKLIPIPYVGIKNTFPLIMMMSGLFLYGSTFVGNIDGLSKRRNIGKKGNGEWWEFIVKYYSYIPISYFVVVGSVIIFAFLIDSLEQMNNGSYWEGGGIGILGKTLFKLFTLSMSIVLSGLAAIPIGIYALLWTIAPDGFDWPWSMPKKWSNAIRDSYLVPENDGCADNSPLEWMKFLMRKLWNNKILLFTFMVIDLVIKLNYGNGNWIDGNDIFNERVFLRSSYTIVIIIIILTMLLQDTIREKLLYQYFTGPIRELYNMIRTRLQSTTAKDNGQSNTG